jgi:hypothetical protein
MPKIEEQIEEDFLEVDKPIPGQNFVCLSFVSPDKVLEQKEKYLFYHYQRMRLQRYEKLFSDAFQTLIAENEDGTVELSRLFDMRKSMDALFKEDELEFRDFKEKFDDFRFTDEKKLGDKFDEMNDFKTSVRGIKVRGVWDTKQEAEMRAKILQRADESFNIFVGQVGYWLPWDPETNDIEDQEYLNEELNKLVKEKKKNDAKKDMFFQEQKSERVKDAMSAAEKVKQKYDDRKKVEEEAKKITEVEVSTTAEPTTEAPTQPEADPVTSSGDLVTTDTPRPSDDTVSCASLDSNKLRSLNDDISVKPIEDPEIAEAVEKMNEVDPWLARKQREQQQS